MMLKVALLEAARTSRALRLDDEGGTIAAKWGRQGVEHLAQLAKRSLSSSSGNLLLAHLKRGLLSRGLELWRAEYSRLNPVAQFYFVRFRRVVAAARRLSEVGGYVVPKANPRCPPGDPRRIDGERASSLPPKPERRKERQRVPRGADLAYERWIEHCLRGARGKLKRRALAELLAGAHGEVVRWPGRGARQELEFVENLQAGEAFDADEDRLESLARAAVWEDGGDDGEKS